MPIQDLPVVRCSCGQDLFGEAFNLRRVSALQSPNGQPTLVKVPAGFLCLHCGLVNSFDEDTAEELSRTVGKSSDSPKLIKP